MVLHLKPLCGGEKSALLDLDVTFGAPDNFLHRLANNCLHLSATVTLKCGLRTLLLTVIYAIQVGTFCEVYIRRRNGLRAAGRIVR